MSFLVAIYVGGERIRAEYKAPWLTALFREKLKIPWITAGTE